MNILIKPIRTKKDYENALAEIGRLLEAKKGTSDFDTLEVLSVLIEAYERKHYPIPPPDAVAAIKFRMDQMGLTKRDLESCIGTRARVSEVLSHKRGLSLSMIRKLRTKLDIPTEVLVGA